jgi:peptide/nickel transport system ATP-binding protein
VLIADEPTSALDVSAQHALTQQLRQLLDKDLVQSIMFITHDLPLLSTVADRIAIMYAGLVAEVGSAREVVDHGWHPYTRALMQAVLAPEPGVRRKRVEGIPGAPPDMRYPPEGCPYQPRCPLRMDICKEDPPAVGAPHRFARCWWVKEHLAELEAQA